MASIGGGYIDNDSIRELRDEFKKLNQSIEKFNKKTSEQTEKMIDLTQKIFLLTIIMVLGLGLQIYLAKIQTTPVLQEQERNERRAYGICKYNPKGDYTNIAGELIKCADVFDYLKKKFE